MNNSDLQYVLPKNQMKSLSMKGPYTLSVEMIEKEILARSPGNYALGYVDGHTFIVKYVGRSDFDLHSRLKDWVGKYPLFKWSYASSDLSAYEKECLNYHDFGSNLALDNLRHPAKLDGKDWKCPVCDE
jgi:hypothetical protein